MSEEPKAKQDRGFRVMDPELRRQISSKGGKVATSTGRAHKWTPEEARIAGRKGGQATHKKRTETT